MAFPYFILALCIIISYSAGRTASDEGPLTVAASLLFAILYSLTMMWGVLPEPPPEHCDGHPYVVLDDGNDYYIGEHVRKLIPCQEAT